MNKKIKIIFYVTVIFCLGVLISFTASCITNNTKAYDRVKVKINIGQSKETIRELLGTPDVIKKTSKRNKYIWGPEELFWDKIPMGSKLELWSYNFFDGGLNLYFVNESETLNYIAFAPKGIVYEAQ